MQVMAHKVVSLVFKDHGLPDADFTVNSVNA